MPPDPISEAHHTLVRTLARAQLDAGPVHALDLQLTPISWEDTTARATEPVLHDMTLEVHSRHHGQRHATPMQVLRRRNFRDRAAAVSLDALRLQVGNHRDVPLRSVTLREYLADLRPHLTRPELWPERVHALLAARDHHALLRAQACLLPAPQTGLTRFTPLLHTDRTRRDTPAVLAILATPEGTSATVVAHHHGQRLLFNRAGQRAPLTATRRNDLSPGTGPTTTDTHAILLIQVPLRRPGPPPDRFAHFDVLPMEPDRSHTGIRPAVLVPGAIEGPFVEIDQPIQRDDRLPIRVTVQLHRTIDGPTLAERDIVELGAQLERTIADPTRAIEPR